MIGKLGKQPPRFDQKMLRLGAYLTPADLPAPPDRVDPPDCTLPMFANDVHSCCTASAAAHLTVAWVNKEHSLGTHILPTDADVLALYDQVNGGRDEGAVETDLLDAWHRVGLGGDCISAWAALNIGDLDHIRLSVMLFGGCYMGWALPLTVQEQGTDTWDVLPSAGSLAYPGSLGGHAMSAIGYDADTLIVGTWARQQRVTWSFVRQYADEGYAPLDPQDWRGDIPGVDADRLLADLQALRG